MYGKLFAQMYDGTLATKGPWQALVTFQQLIILANKNGEVDMTAEAISRRTTIPLEIIQNGLQRLIEDDPDSRTPDEQGRRIVPLSEHRAWGWRIVNYDHYRKIRSEEERREYHRNYMRNKREAVNQNVKVSTSGEQCQPIAVSSKQNAKAIKPTPPSVSLPAWLPEDAWKDFAEMRQKIRAPLTARATTLTINELAKLRAAGHDPVAVLNQSIQKSWRGVFAPQEEKKREDWTANDQTICAKADSLGISTKGKFTAQLIREIKERM